MRETIVEEEITEKEVERVYCDECGDECTDNHRIEPQEVCKGCSSEDSFSTLERFESATLDANEQTYSLGVNIMSSATIALLAPGIVLHAERGDWWITVGLLLGGAAWALAIVRVVLFL